MTAPQMRSPRGGGLLQRTAAASMATPQFPSCRPRLRGAALAVVALCMPLFFGGCASGPPVAKPIDLAAIDDAFRPALAELQAAVNAENDEVARGILAGILTRNPSGDTLAAAQRFGAVLEGRNLLETLHLSLDTESVPGESGRRRVLLRSNSTASVPIELDLGAALLRHRVVAISPAGTERIAAASQTTGKLSGVVVPPAGEPGLELELDSYPLTSPGAIAARDGWQLEIYPGVIRSGGTAYPVEEVVVEPTDRVLLARELPKAQLDQQPLLDFLATAGVFDKTPEEFNPPLLERTVRIAEEHREATLLALSEFSAGIDDDQFARLEPSLRWLLKVTAESYRPAEWRTLLERGGTHTASADLGRLELPDAPPN